MMRIAYLSHSPHLTGAERMLLNMAARLKSDYGVETLILVNSEGPFSEAAIKCGLNVQNLTVPLPWYIFFGDYADTACEYLYKANQSAAEISRIIGKWGAHALVINTLTSVAGVLAAAKLNIPYVLWSHGIIDSSLVAGQGEHFKWSCDSLLVQCSKYRVCPSEWTSSYFAAQFQAPFAIAPNFCEVPQRIEPCQSAVPTFCCLNTWEPNKGVSVLMDAAVLLRKAGLNFKLNVHGAGYQEEELRAKVEKLQLNDVVELKGRTSDPAAVYKSSHALVTASYIESFGMTLIEAMAQGRPVIASATSGHLGIVRDQENGFLCTPGDANEFAAKMEWVIRNPSLAEKMGSKGWEIAKREYSGGHSAKIFYDILLKMRDDESKLSFAELGQRYVRCKMLLGFAKVRSRVLHFPYASFETEGEESQIAPLEKMTHLRPLINPPHTEKVVCQDDSFSALSFYVGTHCQRLTGKIMLKILNIETGECLRTSELDLDSVKDNSPVTLQFKPLLHMRSKSVYIAIDARADGPLAIYAEPGDNKTWSKIKRKVMRHKPKLHVVMHP